MVALAELEYSQGNQEKAASLLQQARTASPTALIPRLILGRLALERGDLKLAREASIEAEGLEVDNPQVLLLRAMVTARTDDTAEFERYLDRLQAYLSGAPLDAASYWLSVGDLQRRAGRLDLARGTFQQALANPATEKSALVSLIQLETAATRRVRLEAYLARLKKSAPIRH